LTSIVLRSRKTYWKPVFFEKTGFSFSVSQ